MNPAGADPYALAARGQVVATATAHALRALGREQRGSSRNATGTAYLMSLNNQTYR